MSFWLENKMKPKGFRLSGPVVCFGFGPFNGFGHYDYECEINPKNSMFFGQQGKITQKKWQNRPKILKKMPKNLFLKNRL